MNDAPSVPVRNGDPSSEFRQMAGALSGRLQQVACALLATREYNGPNRHKLMKDSFDLIQAIDTASVEVLKRAAAEHAKAMESGPKIVVGGSDA